VFLILRAGLQRANSCCYLTRARGRGRAPTVRTAVTTPTRAGAGACLPSRGQGAPRAPPSSTGSKAARPLGGEPEQAVRASRWPRAGQAGRVAGAAGVHGAVGRRRGPVQNGII